MEQKQSVGSKIFNDAIHKTIEMKPLCVSIINTREFQRLRHIRQLGMCEWVYPSATCNRFEHSLGVCHLAGKMISHLKNEFGKAVGDGDHSMTVTKEEELCVEIAALCHDLGHAAFSHTWETFLSKARPDLKWKHESKSVELFNGIYKQLEREFHANNLYEEQRELIVDIILGDASKCRLSTTATAKKEFLFEIVANKRSGVDVDKWDYLLRDTYCTNVSTFQYDRFLQCSRIMWNKTRNTYTIHYRDSERRNFDNMFKLRLDLYASLYKHKVVKVIEDMFIEALLAADNSIHFENLPLSHWVDNYDAFLQLRDNVFDKLLALDRHHKARILIDKIETRKLYKCVGYATTAVRVTADEVVDGILLEGNGFTSEQFYVDVDKFDYGMGNDDPVKHIDFYGKPTLVIVNACQEARQIEEWKILVVCNDTEINTVNSVKEAFAKWSRKNQRRLQFQIENSDCNSSASEAP